MKTLLKDIDSDLKIKAAAAAVELITKFDSHVKVLFKTTDMSINGEEITARTHAKIGIIGEVGEIADCIKQEAIYGLELDKENLLEECGDLFFYIIALNQHSPDKIMGVSQDIKPKLVEIIAADLLNASQQGDLSDSNMIELAEYLSVFSGSVVKCTILRHMLNKCDFTITDALEHNIEKLKSRYPEGYSDKNAVTRLDKVKGL